jgi:hypothetical protein
MVAKRARVMQLPIAGLVAEEGVGLGMVRNLRSQNWGKPV